jgi:3-phenylpropionate/cinnamic acid dioxygenase small subunit
MRIQSEPASGASYVDAAFYQELAESFSGWDRDDRLVADPALREACRMLLEREARLLDQRRFADWLALYAERCLYWVPATDGGDPRSQVALAFDDRRRLEDRIFRFATGYAWSQIPPSRTARLVANIEAFATERDTVLMVRSSFMISEFRQGETRRLTGWNAHRLIRQGDRWAILVKQTNLIDCDQNLRNPSIIL